MPVRRICNRSVVWFPCIPFINVKQEYQPFRSHVEGFVENLFGRYGSHGFVYVEAKT